MNEKRLRWWDISGQSESGTTFIHIVEATSRKKVIRRIKRIKQCKDFDGNIVPVTFPHDQGQIRIHSNKWSPGTLTHLYIPDTKTIVQVIRAQRYQCECGQIHISDIPFPSMWCSCGKKAYPIQEVHQKSRDAVPREELMVQIL
ncbi:hypothetical protein LLE49_07410 [Alicyclobacillus tolerans]|uniref:hypothetical protein n=1 Tax=Alicyclobacillus tolerans TaxID=90970 RepID=UPI001F3BA17C|nr:hypothetical protein [Alicyclobacillus tolerans]MCF8564571.1 hypothetical protein [Alicyclobacillus tolerans]